MTPKDFNTWAGKPSPEESGEKSRITSLLDLVNVAYRVYCQSCDLDPDQPQSQAIFDQEVTSRLATYPQQYGTMAGSRGPEQTVAFIVGEQYLISAYKVVLPPEGHIEAGPPLVYQAGLMVDAFFDWQVNPPQDEDFLKRYFGGGIALGMQNYISAQHHKARLSARQPTRRRNKS